MGSSNLGLSEEEMALRKQLDRANADFEQFVSMTAHNLRQSLRDIASYGQLISETCATRLDSDATAYLARIQEGAAAMESLLADVVDYWATVNGGGQSSRIDMEAALVQALLLADPQIKERSAVVTHDPLPPVAGNFEILTKVLSHLIENAIEYCEEATPRVHLSARRADAEWVFSVHDNGPGIEAPFRNRVFEAFKRLHGKEHPGNGLGLSFCKKAIESQGGRIWVESTLGAGSTFYFTLPPAE